MNNAGMPVTSARLASKSWQMKILSASASGLSIQHPCGEGLCATAAEEMGLPIGTPVAVGMIDAHAGGIGTVGVLNGAVNNMAYVFGTSSCTMTTTQEAVFVPGVWGPYYSAMVPGYWLSEGGQSAAGAAIDQLLSFHPAAAEAREHAKAAGVLYRSGWRIAF